MLSCGSREDALHLTQPPGLLPRYLLPGLLGLTLGDPKSAHPSLTHSSPQGEPVVWTFDEVGAFPSLVVDHDALHAYCVLGLVGDGHFVADGALFVRLIDEGGAGL